MKSQKYEVCHQQIESIFAALPGAMLLETPNGCLKIDDLEHVAKQVI